MILQAFAQEAAEGLRDIKDPVYFPVDYLPFLITLIVLLSVGIYFLLRRFAGRRKADKEKISVRTRPPHETAYGALEALQAKGLPPQGRFKEYYYELSLIVRHYIEERFEIRAPEMTTEEFLSALGESEALTEAHRGLLKEFLILCDIVKFAKYGPTPQEADDSFGAAWKFVDETKGTREESVLVK